MSECSRTGLGPTTGQTRIYGVRFCARSRAQCSKANKKNTPINVDCSDSLNGIDEENPYNSILTLLSVLPDVCPVHV